MGTAALAPDGAPAGAPRDAKDYARRKYTLNILETLYTLMLLFVFAGTGLSRVCAERLRAFTGSQLLILPLYLALLLAGYAILNFPFSYYGSYRLEHAFSLSCQRFGQWLIDELKSGVIGYIIGLILAAVFLYIAARFPETWWLAVSVFWIAFSLVLAKLAPVIIIPLFFKYKKLSDEDLRRRILRLAGKMRVKLMDVFQIDFSKKTVKANAAFTGWGSTRRVILADTLTDRYTHDEIEVILAHEFAHYKLKHILKLIVINSLATLAAFCLIHLTRGRVFSWFGLSSFADVAGLPVVCIYFMIFGILMQPFQAGISRVMERGADRMALQVTGNKEAFISMMEKLGSQNLSDPDPHPFIKFYFYDHPPIAERVAFARSFPIAPRSA